MPMQTWNQQTRAIEAQDAYRHARDQQRRFQDWEINKERSADPIEEPEFDEEEMERNRR